MLKQRGAPAPQPQEAEDEVLERKPSHPVSTMLLIASAVALVLAIALTTKELQHYLNPDTKKKLKEYKITAVKYYEAEFHEEGKPGMTAEEPAESE